MGADIHGWVEVAREPRTWAGVLCIDDEVERDQQMFDCLFQFVPNCGVVAVQYDRGLPNDISQEMREYLRHGGWKDDIWSGFCAEWASFKQIEWGPVVSWPTIDIELWWERSPRYELKSRSHNPSQLMHEELVQLVREGGALDKAQNRYIARPGKKQLHVSAAWQSLFGRMGQWAKAYGQERVRLVGFFE